MERTLRDLAVDFDVSDTDPVLISKARARHLKADLIEKQANPELHVLRHENRSRHMRLDEVFNLQLVEYDSLEPFHPSDNTAYYGTLKTSAIIGAHNNSFKGCICTSSVGEEASGLLEICGLRSNEKASVEVADHATEASDIVIKNADVDDYLDIGFNAGDCNIIATKGVEANQVRIGHTVDRIKQFHVKDMESYTVKVGNGAEHIGTIQADNVYAKSAHIAYDAETVKKACVTGLDVGSLELATYSDDVGGVSVSDVNARQNIVIGHQADSIDYLAASYMDAGQAISLADGGSDVGTIMCNVIKSGSDLMIGNNRDHIGSVGINDASTQYLNIGYNLQHVGALSCNHIKAYEANVGHATDSIGSLVARNISSESDVRLAVGSQTIDTFKTENINAEHIYTSRCADSRT